VGLLFSARPPPCSCPLARACVDARTLAQALTEALRLHSALVLLLSPTASSRQASRTGEADTLQLLGGQAREDEGDEEAGRRRRGWQQPQKGRALVAPRHEDDVSAARSPAMSAEELKAWFVNDLSPARQLDALCSMWGGTSDILLDLMLSPDNQALAYLVAALASLHTRPSFESASPSSGSYRHEDGPIGGNELKVGDDPPATASDSSGASAVPWRCRLQGVLQGPTKRWLRELQVKMDSMQRRRLLPFKYCSAPLSARAPCPRVCECRLPTLSCTLDLLLFLLLLVSGLAVRVTVRQKFHTNLGICQRCPALPTPWPRAGRGAGLGAGSTSADPDI
jgi:hypothetical protein